MTNADRVQGRPEGKQGDADEVKTIEEGSNRPVHSRSEQKGETFLGEASGDKAQPYCIGA